MLRTRTSIAALAASLVTLVAIGCGGEDPGETGAGGGGTGGGGTGEIPGRPPPPDPAAPEGEDGQSVTLAINKLNVGEAPNAWRSLGFNIDGKVSNGAEEGHCKPVEGAPNPDAVRTDGNDGIDNSFGQLILPQLSGLVSDISGQANAEIADGTFTLMLDIQGLGSGASYNGLETRFYGGAILDNPPKFDGTDEWPVVPELLNGGDIENPKIKFTDSYVVDNTFVSGAPASVNLNLSFGDITVNLTIEKAQLSMELAPGHDGATQGIIGGVVETEALLAELRKLASSFNTEFCDPENPALKSIENSIRRASDIMADGTQNPDAECNAISLGIGFEMKPVKLGPVAPETTVEPGACP